MSDWDEYIKEHSDLEWTGDGELTEPNQQEIIALCVKYFDTGN